MNKVITIHLHGKAYQVEEPGYNKLQTYLEQAKQQLANDPDKDEIIADLEQGIGEKLDRFLSSHKTVSLESDVDAVLKEMGPVQSSAESAPTDSQNASKTSSTPKRLYLIPEGAMIRGVCTGLAAYFNVDVTLIRILFVLLTILTHGLGILIYLILMIVVPPANTSAQKAQAYGLPYTAQEFVDRARTEFNKYSNKYEWKKARREFKDKIRQQRWERRAQRHQGYPHWHFSPLLGLLSAVLSILWIVGLVQLIGKGMVFGLMVPASIPLWVAILIWLCVYGFVMSAIKGARYVTYQEGQKVHYHHDGFFETIVWLAFVVLVVWFVWTYIPAAHPALVKVNLWWQHVWAHLRNR